MATIPETSLLPEQSEDMMPSQPTVLADAIQQTQNRQRQDFVSTLQTVADVNPDQWAKATQVSKLSGIPADVLHQHSEQMNQLLKGNKYAALYDNYKRTAESLANGQTAALAQDDIDNLTRIEHAKQVTRFEDQGIGEKLWGAVKQAWQSGEQGSDLAYADRLERLTGTFDRIDEEVTKAALEGRQPYAGGKEPTGFAFDYLNSSPEQRLAMRERLLGRQAGALTDAAQTQKTLDEQPIEPGALRYQELGGDFSAMAQAISQNPGYAVRTAIGSAASSAPMLVAGAIGGPFAAGAVELGMEYDSKLLDILREAKIDVTNPKAVLTALQDDKLMTEARATASRKALGTTAVDVIGMGLAGKLLVPKSIGGQALTAVQREGVNVAVQIPVQGAIGALSEATGQLAADGEVNGGDVLMEAIAGAGMSTVEVATFGGSRIIDNVQEGLAKSRQARQGRDTLNDMAEAARESKTRGRDPAVFNDIVTNQLRDSPMESISIPAEALAKLNQDGAPPVLDELLARVPGLTEQFAEAQARGGSVQIKTADYLTAFADYHDSLAQSVRTQIDGMSIEESQAWQEGQATQIEELAALLAREPDARDDAFVGMMGELQQAGYRRADAEQYATVHLAAMSTLAERSGKSLQEIMQRFPLDIRTKAPDSIQRIPVDDMRIAIGRLRTGDIPQSRDLFGKSLSEYLRDAGGLNDAGGELAALDADVGKVGRNRLIKAEGGLSLDDAAMRAWERGYFPGVPREEVGPQLIVDAVQRDLAGTPTYSSEQENATLKDQAVNLQNLQDYLDRLGVNLNELDDDQVLAVLRNPESIEGVKLDDVSPQLPERADGSSARVGENGLTIVHGSGNETLSLDDIQIVRATGQKQGKKGRVYGGFYGTSEADSAQAQGYAGMMGGSPTLFDIRLKPGTGVLNKTGDVTRLSESYIKEIVSQGYGLVVGTDPRGRTEYVVVDKNAIESIGKRGDTTLNQTGSPVEPRGYIDFNQPKDGQQRKFQITVTGRRDLSTLLHEFGHFYLEVTADLAQDADAPQQIRDDIAAIRAWTGAKAIGPFEVAEHEQFARGFEAYLAEGKAPNPELQGAFSRFKRWIISIYKDLRRLNVDLTPEIRGVMDRIIATDEQIRNAELVTQAMPMFDSAAKAGMTEAEFAAYRNQVELAHAEAQTTVEQQIIREEERRRSKWWSEESARVATEVSEELDSLPEYAAIRALRRGIMPDGTLANIKLNSAEIREQYGQAVTRKLAFMHAKDGQSMDIVASMLAFGSGDEMVKAILGAPSRADLIKQETQQRMEERHGARSSGEAAERAMNAVHNEKHGAVLLRELNALGKQGNRKNITSQQTLKLAAERIMQQRKVRDIQPFEYQRAEGTAGRRAFDAAARGDLAAAYEAKQQQILNFHLWREAKKARDSIDTIVDRMAGFNKSTRREKLGKAGHSYLDQVDAVMEQYEFRKVSLRDLDRRVSFAQWYADQLAAGNEPDVPEFILNTSQRVNYKDLSLEQLQELDDFVQNVNHLAGLKNKLMANQRLRDFNDAKDQMVAAARQNLTQRKALPIDKGTMSVLENAGQTFGNMNSSLLKMEQITEWLDGGDVDGPWHQAFWQPFVEAQIEENDINRELTTQLMANIDAHQRVNGRKSLQDKVHIPEIGQTFSRNAILATALNVGNAGNRTKLLKGYKWEEHQLAAILSHMNKADWEFVQAQWDLVDSLWPRIETLEKDLHGVAPEKVQATPVSTPHGEFAGGYWPLVYDVTSPAYANVANTLADGTGLFEEGYGKATTPRGHTKARVDGFAAPLMLDTGIVANHLGQVVHDLTHRRAIMDAAKIIGNAEIKQALIDTLGNNIANQFNPWLRGVANDRTMDSQKGISFWAKALQQGSANLSIAWMGFSVTTGIQQILGYSQSLEHLAQTGGRRFLFQGMTQFVTKPFETIAWVKSLSGEMRNRDANLDNNIREALRASQGNSNLNNVIKRLAFKHIAVIQSFVDYPTWLAGYRQALDAGETQDVAVATGDRAVRLSQMSGGSKDLAAVQRNTIMKPFTIVYSYFNLLYNRQADLVHTMKTAQGAADYLKAFERTMYLITLPAIMGPLLLGSGPKDDESYAKWAALKIATYPLMGVPFVRDAASALESGWAYSGATPIGDVFKTTTRLAHAATQDELDAEKVTLGVMDAAGLTLGIPVAQPKRAVKYLFAVDEGTAPDETMIDWIKGLMLGPPKEPK